MLESRVKQLPTTASGKSMFAAAVLAGSTLMTAEAITSNGPDALTAPSGFSTATLT